MNPRLVKLGDGNAGQTWSISGEVFTVGRRKTNDLQIPQPAVSRDHCVIRRQGERFVVQDLDSAQGTFVNRLPVGDRELEHGDLLTIGETRLLFLLDDPSEVGPREAPDRGAVLTPTTLEKSPTEIFYLQQEAAAAEEQRPEATRMARDLHAVLELGKTLQALRKNGEVAECLLEAIFNVLPAERGAVLLAGSDGEDLVPAGSRSLRPDEPFVPSGSVTGRVLQRHVALLCRDVMVDETLRESGSVEAAGLSSILAVPLVSRTEMLGVLYCDTRGGQSFTEHHLDLLTAMAGIASLAFENARHLEWVHRTHRLEAEPRLRDLVGESPSMKRLFKLIGQVSRADSTVLIRGESGTGKELTARAIHQASPRVDAPFLAVNCATLSDALLESELFGHEKGAFTGAVARKIGKLEAAHTGTLFLDEVGELDLPLQAKLLRVLQEREFERVGGTRPIQVDIRLLAATNRDLEAAIREGGFREDLYYRLNVITLPLPPLRERRSDIPLLASHFAERHARRLQGGAVGFSPEARRALTAYHWPGNVRQLSNVIERALVLGQDEVIHTEDLPDEILEGGEAPPGDFQATVLETKKKLILTAYRDAAGDHQQAARLLGLHVNSLHRLIRNLKLRSQLTQKPSDDS